MSRDDEQWLSRKDKEGRRRLVSGVTEIVPGVQMIQAGGHFDGSAVLLWEGKVFVADTMMITPVSCWMKEIDGLCVSANICVLDSRVISMPNAFRILRRFHSCGRIQTVRISATSPYSSLIVLIRSLSDPSPTLKSPRHMESPQAIRL